jgi:hypothetical protein
MYGPEENVHPNVEEIRYPKPGETNPTVSIHVWRNNKLLEMKLSERNDFYIFSLNFKDNENLIATFLNRQMNKKEFIIGKINENSVDVTNIIQNKNDGQLMEMNVNSFELNKYKGWIAHSKSAFFFGDKYVDVVPYNDHFHVGLFNLQNGELIKFLGKEIFFLNQ